MRSVHRLFIAFYFFCQLNTLQLEAIFSYPHSFLLFEFYKCIIRGKAWYCNKVFDDFLFALSK